LWIDHHPLSEDAANVLAEDTARHETNDELLVSDDERVTRVRTSAVAHDHIRALGEDVDDLAFALVAPLRAYDHDRRHLYAPAFKAPLQRRTGARPRSRLGQNDPGRSLPRGRHLRSSSAQRPRPTRTRSPTMRHTRARAPLRRLRPWGSPALG